VSTLRQLAPPFGAELSRDHGDDDHDDVIDDDDEDDLIDDIVA
jgi:hypothetical protein